MPSLFSRLSLMPAVMTVVLLVGCGHTKLVENADRLPLRAVDGRHESLLRGIERSAGSIDADEKPTRPWYASRCDAQPTVYHGYVESTVSRIVRIAHDHQRSSRGRVRDHYHRRTNVVEVTTSYR